MRRNNSPDAAALPAHGSDQSGLDSPAHVVQFYKEEATLLDALCRFIGSALGAGDAALVIATESHREELTERLKDCGLDVALALQHGRYVPLDAAETLSKFMLDGWPDAARFADYIGNIISRAKTAAKGEQPRVVVFGEMVALLWAQGRPEAAIRLEQLWNELAQTHSFCLHCAYPMQDFFRETHTDAFQKICAEHSHVIPVESYVELSAEARLRSLKQEELYRLKLAAIVEASDDAIASKDLNGIVTSWNATAERMFGYTAQEIIGRPITLIIPPELQGDEQFILGKIRRGEKIDHFETRRITKTGGELDVSLTVSPIKDDDGKVIGVAKILRDITQRKKMDEALRTTEKLAAAGRLAASVAHEINNPLATITNLVFLAQCDPQLSAASRQYLSAAEEELARVSQIAKQTLGFYRETASPRPVRISEVFKSLQTLYGRKIRDKNIHFEVEVKSENEVTAVAGELRQLFANVLANSIDAVSVGGRIRARITTSWKNGVPGVRATIGDNGVGIPRPLRSKIFDPFFTSKKDVGTGLGLWVAQRVAEKHRGSIKVRSSAEDGESWTVVSIFLPLEGAPVDVETRDRITGTRPSSMILQGSRPA